jgi:hypothetical protein
MSNTTHITFGRASIELRCLWRHLGKLAKANRIPYVQAGHIRLIAVADLPAIKQELIRAGYVQEEPAHAAIA